VCSGDEVNECTISQELLWLWSGDSLGTQDRERPPLEAVTRGLLKRQQTKMTQCVSELQTV
jgi:hypothetical protein